MDESDGEIVAEMPEAQPQQDEMMEEEKGISDAFLVFCETLYRVGLTRPATTLEVEASDRTRSESPLTPPPSPTRPSQNKEINARDQINSGHMCVDEDSDLTELEDEESESEIEATPRPKATKLDTATKSKAKSKSKAQQQKKDKGKGKAKSKGKVKGKGKQQATAMSDSESEEEEKKPKVRVKKQLLAKAVYWDDIPDWGDSDRCQLLEMPAEILDMMFGLQPGIKVSRRWLVSLGRHQVLMKSRKKSMLL